MMGTWLPKTCWATIRREIKNTKSDIQLVFLIHTVFCIMMCNLVNGYQHFGDTLWPTSHTCSNPDHNPSLHYQNSVCFLVCMHVGICNLCTCYGSREHKHRFTSSAVVHVKLCTNLTMHCTFFSSKVRLGKFYYTVKIICEDQRVKTGVSLCYKAR